MERSLTCGKVNTPTDAFLPTITTHQQETSSNFTTSVGAKERIFDDMNNGFGWNRLPKSFMAENTVFLLLTALIHNFYKTIISKLDTKAFGLKETSRIKAFCLQIHLRTCQVDHDSKEIRAEYLY